MGFQKIAGYSKFLGHSNAKTFLFLQLLKYFLDRRDFV